MLAKIVRECYGKEISECGKEELYHALLTLVQKKAGEKEENTGKIISDQEKGGYFYED